MRLRFRIGVLMALSATMVAGAQETPSTPEEPIRTLHVYTNLIQVPTLVLSGNKQPMQGTIGEKQFSVSIDSGRWFRVTHARLEGNDPISLSILLDTSVADLISPVREAMGAPSWLSPLDRVSIYVLDCGLVRSLNDTPADGRMLTLGMDAALKSWTTRKVEAHGKGCKQTVHLWDAIGYVASELSKLPGRRVILLITDGRDRGSARTWNEVRIYLQAMGVAVFGLTTVPLAPSLSGWRWNNSDVNALNAICELSGGMLTVNYPAMAGKTVQRLIPTLRGRYILEFPRPSNSTAGAHDMRVKVEQGQGYFVRPSGISIPLPDPDLAKDPSTVLVGPAETPEQGKRRVLMNPK